MINSFSTVIFINNENQLKNYATKNQNLYLDIFLKLLSNELKIYSSPVIENFKDRCRQIFLNCNKQSKHEDDLLRIIGLMKYGVDYENVNSEPDFLNVIYLTNKISKGNFESIKTAQSCDLFGVLIKFLSAYLLIPDFVKKYLLDSIDIYSKNVRLESTRLILMLLDFNQREILFNLLQLIKMLKYFENQCYIKTFIQRITSIVFGNSEDRFEFDDLTSNLDKYLDCLLISFPQIFNFPELFKLEYNKSDLQNYNRVVKKPTEIVQSPARKCLRKFQKLISPKTVVKSLKHSTPVHIKPGNLLKYFNMEKPNIIHLSENLKHKLKKF